MSFNASRPKSQRPTFQWVLRVLIRCFCTGSARKARGIHWRVELSKADYLDPRWQKKRLEILKRDDFCCQSCFDSESTLHVHHLYYCKGRAPWEYPDFSLITLCDECHQNAETDCRDDEGKYVEAEWERIVDFLCNGQPISGILPAASGLWDMACEVGMTINNGHSHGRAMSVLLHAIHDFRLETANK